MRSKIKVISILIILSLTSVMLMGCDTTEMEVFDGIMKEQKITSYESDTNIKFNVSVDGLTEQEYIEAEQFLYMINNSDITIHQKMKNNEDQTKAKAQIDLNMNLAGMLLDAGIWVDSDLTGEEMVLKEVFKLPQIAMMAMPEEYRYKEYFVLDLNEVMEQGGTNDIDFKELMELSKELQPIMEDFMKSYSKSFSFNKKIITYEGKEKIDGETVKVYELKFDDETFKEFLRYSIHSLIENDATEDFMKKYFEIIVRATENMNSENEIAQEEMDEILNEMSNIFTEESRAEILDTVDAFFDKVKDVTILGEKGLTIGFKINKEGYIVNTNGKMHFSIKPTQIEESSMEQYYLEEGLNNNVYDTEAEEVTIDIEVDFNTDMYNINEDISIELPELTEENSVSFTDILEAQMNMISNQTEALNNPTYTQPESINLSVNGQLMNVEPVIAGNSVLVPMRQVFESMGFEIAWDPVTETVTGIKGETEIKLSIDSNVAYINNEQVTLSIAPTLMNTTAVVPLDFITVDLGAETYWDHINETLIIDYK